MTKQSEQTSDKPFPFTELSPELRNAIYEDLVGDTFTVEVRATKKSPMLLYRVCGLRLHGTKQDAAILRANKQIHLEAISILYSTKIFWFGSGQSMTQFIRQREKVLPFIQHINFTKWTLTFARILSTNWEADGRLPQLGVLARISNYDSFDEMAEQLYKPLNLLVSKGKDVQARRQRFDGVQMECAGMYFYATNKENDGPVEMTTKLVAKFEQLFIAEGMLKPLIEKEE